MTTEVSTNADLNRYEIHVDGELAGFTEYRVEGTRVVLPHTRIEEKFGGQGLASKLIGAALDDLRGQGMKVVPMCPFVRSFIERNPGYQDLVA